VAGPQEEEGKCAPVNPIGFHVSRDRILVDSQPEPRDKSKRQDGEDKRKRGAKDSRPSEEIPVPKWVAITTPTEKSKVGKQKNREGERIRCQTNPIRNQNDQEWIEPLCNLDRAERIRRHHGS